MTETTSGLPPAPPVLTAEFHGAAGFAQFRAVIADICAAGTLEPEDRFHLATTTLHLGGAVVVDASVTPVCYDRSPEYVARSRIDHYQVAIYLRGACEYDAGRRTVRMGTGDVFIIDMAGPNRTRIERASDGGEARVLTFMLPRMLLAPLLAAPDAVQGAVIRADTPLGRLAAAQMLALREEPGTGADVADALGELLHVVARGAGPAEDLAEHVGAPARDVLVSRAKRHIEDSLAAEDLDTDTLCRHFAVSRATLYRLFDAEGGLAGYIRQRRLMRAYGILASAEGQHRRILDLALESRFASDATFVRAFHRAFGLTPGEVRQRGAEAAAHPLGPDRDDEPGFKSTRWVRELRPPRED